MGLSQFFIESLVIFEMLGIILQKGTIKATYANKKSIKKNFVVSWFEEMLFFSTYVLSVPSVNDLNRLDSLRQV